MTVAFVDTNILLYAVSAHPEERKKILIAREILNQGDFALSTQVLQEFYWIATKPKKLGLTHQQALELIDLWKLFPIQAISTGVVDEALAICNAHRISYWDAAIVSAARHMGCTILYTEDLNHGQIFGDTRICNPFKE